MFGIIQLNPESRTAVNKSKLDMSDTNVAHNITICECLDTPCGWLAGLAGLVVCLAGKLLGCLAGWLAGWLGWLG